jgi:hypothetical protein
VAEENRDRIEADSGEISLKALPALIEMPNTVKQSCLWPAVLAVVLSCAIQPGYAADTNAVIPYKALDEIFQPITKVDPTRLEIHVFVSSSNKAVHPSDISLTIQSATKGMIPVLLGTNGQVLKFPVEKDLRRENPPVIVNQPKGTVRLGVAIQLPPSDELTFRYSRLGDGVAEINKSIKAQAGMVLSLLAPKVEGVVFLFPKAGAGKAKIEIASAAGKREYTADMHGQIKLKLEKALLAENPEVKVSEKPEHIVPDMSDM